MNVVGALEPVQHDSLLRVPMRSHMGYMAYSARAMQGAYLDHVPLLQPPLRLPHRVEHTSDRRAGRNRMNRRRALEVEASQPFEWGETGDTVVTVHLHATTTGCVYLSTVRAKTHLDYWRSYRKAPTPHSVSPFNYATLVLPPRRFHFGRL
jgi:hypothetical protein